jgi:hypothetical protein
MNCFGSTFWSTLSLSRDRPLLAALSHLSFSVKVFTTADQLIYHDPYVILVVEFRVESFFVDVTNSAVNRPGAFPVTVYHLSASTWV